MILESTGDSSVISIESMGAIEIYPKNDKSENNRISYKINKMKIYFLHIFVRLH